ncbi:hypothetical protein TWF694_010558 [Orbilia ellipsospora]|uniref:DUF427 domain-containing protein n=1 Tax=Orbilia ellipsospora TaxID=2528407 RepID=A0AAV9XBD7_9PEZI
MEAQVIHNGVVIAESRKYIKLEGNVYFPPDTIVTAYYRLSPTRTACPIKGLASYLTIDMGDGSEPLTDAAWYYPEPKKGHEHIANHVAFYSNKVSVQLP